MNNIVKLRNLSSFFIHPVSCSIMSTTYSTYDALCGICQYWLRMLQAQTECQALNYK